MMHRELCRSAQQIALADGRTCVRAVFEVDTDSTPDRIHVLPAGKLVKARDGRAFTVSDPKKVIAASTFPLLLDWEHQSESMFGSTRAAGWINSISLESTGMWGRVEWTAQGLNDVRSKAFRYLSPVLVVARAENDNGPGEVQSIISVALTNKPALHLSAIEAFSQQMAKRAPVVSEEQRKRAECAERVTQALVAQGFSRDAVEAAREELEAKKRGLSTLDMAKVRERLRTRGYSDEQIADAERCQAAQRGR